MSHLNNPILLTSNSEIKNFPTLVNFYYDFLMRLHNQFPRGFIYMDLFLKDNTPFRGDVLQRMINEYNAVMVEHIKKYPMLSLHGYQPREFIMVNWLAFTDTQDLLRKVMITLIDVINHRIDPIYLAEPSGEGFYAAYKLFFDKIKPT